MSNMLTCRRIGGTPGQPGELSPWPWNPGDRLLTEGTKPLGRKDFEGDGIISGIWTCNAGAVEIRGHPVNEICFVVRGSVTVTDEGGRAETFKAGEGFLLPRGFGGQWSNSDDFAKLFVAVESNTLQAPS
jgi:uncharacterized cupin superfamily protein